jgi:hypothetical protein
MNECINELIDILMAGHQSLKLWWWDKDLISMREYLKAKLSHKLQDT